LLLIGLFFLSTTIGLAQTTETRRVLAGEDVAKFLSENGLFRFSTFSAGTYAMKNGSTAPALLNYNLLLGEMQYISPQKEVLSIANPQDFSFFKVNDVTFYFRDGYKEIIKDYGTYKLAVGIEIVLTSEKTTAYGSPAGATKTTTLSSFQGLGGNYNGGYSELKPIENSVITKKTTYYILDNKNSADVASKKNIQKIFGSNALVADYLKSNSVNFNKREDLIKLLDFYAQQAK
ncbi:MAG TPA: hypothetical protein DIT07_08515, partial [Sphingobacteriaceae bacterium]|nr:hypothetical protein [Sphingobacteriaceae bacterium]